MLIRFYNRDGRWFADLPDYIAQGGTEDECEMVCGADTWLDYLSEGKDQVFLEVSTTEPLAEQLQYMAEDADGGIYMAWEYGQEPFNHQLWLCEVTKFVFGDFPKFIYYKVKHG